MNAPFDWLKDVELITPYESMTNERWYTSKNVIYIDYNIHHVWGMPCFQIIFTFTLAAKVCYKVLAMRRLINN